MRPNALFALLSLAACSEQTFEPVATRALVRGGTAARSTAVTGYTVRQLPSLDAGFSPAEVHDVDSHGHAVGMSAYKAVMWLGSDIEEVVPGAYSGVATGLNDAHQIVGYYFTPEGGQRAFVRNPGGAVAPLPDLSAGEARAEAINSVGQIVGEVSDGPFSVRAALWKPGVGGYTLTLLDLDPAFQHSFAFDINAAGVIVGHEMDASGLTTGRAAVWTTTGALTDVGPGILYAVNALGEYVGFDMEPDVGARAFRGIGAARTLLEGARTVAYDINDHGLVAGNMIYALDPYEERAVIWQATEAGILPADLYGERRPVAINNAGVMGGHIGPVAVLWEPTAPPTVGDLLGDLRADVASLGARLAPPLLAKLDAASASLARGQGRAAAGQIGAFVNQLKALVRRGDLSAERAAQLLARAEAILARL